MLCVDAVSGELYLQLQAHSKTEDVVRYLVGLCQDAHRDQVEKLFIVLDNNPTHKAKMKNLLKVELEAVGIASAIAVEFIHTPSYSPDFNLVEYEIHLLRLEKLHHLPSDVTISDIERKLDDVKFLMNKEQISRTLEHIFALAPMSIA